MDNGRKTDPLRIACYGYAAPDAGSVASASYVVLRELLDREIEIDFFGKRSFAYPAGLERYSNFRYVNVEGRAERLFGFQSRCGPKTWRALMGSLTHGQTIRNIGSAICAEHPRRNYAVQLFLGNWAFRRVRSLPAVSWVQGPPGTDSRSIAANSQLLRRTEGLPRYLLLRVFAAYRNTLGKPPVRNTDLVICGGSWAAATLRPYVAKAVKIETLPYPVDLKTFRPNCAFPKKIAPEVLWVGRSVPRKRLDLFLSACELLIESGRDIIVRIVGGFDFAPGYRKLLDEFRFPDRLHWVPNVPRAEVPAILRAAAVLVQPSEEENFGSSVAEALACGTPVVVGPTNGTGGYIGGAGRVFDRYEKGSVAGAIAAVLDGVSTDPEGWSFRSRAAAEEFFGVSSIATKLEGIICRLGALKHSQSCFRATTDDADAVNSADSAAV